MNKVIEWVRANVAIVVFGVVIVAALVLGPLLAGRWNDSVRAEAESRASKLSQLESLGRSTVTLSMPGEAPVTLTTAINPYILKEYERVVGELRSDAAEVRTLAIAHNSKGRGVLIPRVFPEMPATERDTLPPEMRAATIAAYEKLLREVRAGMPPSAESVAQVLAAREEQYIFTTVRKQKRSDLDPQELEDLTAELSRARLARYGDAAQSIGMYASIDALPAPAADGPPIVPPGVMFEWQWNYWLTQDILDALRAANEQVAGPQGSVVENPVKRIVSLRPLDRIAVDPGTTAGGGGTRPGSGRGAPNFGNFDPGGAVLPPSEESGGLETGAPAATGGGSADPSVEAPRNYASSFTGRVTNPLYDVRPVELQLVVATAQLPVVLDALAKRNFMTVLDVDLVPADPFAAAREGFIYGSEPVAVVTLLVETIWLREWTAPFMPADVRESLKVSLPQPGQPESADQMSPPA